MTDPSTSARDRDPADRAPTLSDPHAAVVDEALGLGKRVFDLASAAHAGVTAETVLDALEIVRRANLVLARAVVAASADGETPERLAVAISLAEPWASNPR